MPAEMTSDVARVTIDGREVTYRIRRTRSSRGLRIRVGTTGVEVLTPSDRPSDPTQFLLDHGQWVVHQLDRVNRVDAARRPRQLGAGEILLRGNPTRVSAEVSFTARRDRVEWADGLIAITLASTGRCDAALTLERAMRSNARAEIEQQVADFSRRRGVIPGRLYIMDQRTKWGNCSRRGNLSFNWRLLMAPPTVLTYLVAHETLHLAIPDHSQRFWLALQSVCPETERSRQWLAANNALVRTDLRSILTEAH